MTLSLGPVVDYLYTKAQAAVSGVTVNGTAAQASDGWPDEPVFGSFAVGVTAPPPDGIGEVPVQRDWSDIGDRYVVEDYTVPCYIDVRVNGTAQKAARDQAAAIFNTFWAELLTDLSLGGAVQGEQPVAITEFRSTGSKVGTVAEPGRRQLITFGVHCINLTH